MKIVILGGGTVGTAIAEALSHSSHSITVVDRNPEVAAELKNRDFRCITGSVSESTTLFEAGVSDSDFCFALTNSDESNIIAASLAKAMGCKRSLARVYAPVFRNLSTFDYQDHFKIDRLVSLEHLTAIELVRLIRRGRSHVLDLLNMGSLEVQEIIVGESSPIIGRTLRDLRLPSSVRVALLRRNGDCRIMLANDEFQQEDGVSLIGTNSEIAAVIQKQFKAKLPHPQKIMIMGGGETGFHVADLFQADFFDVCLFETDVNRINFLNEALSSRIKIIAADALDRYNLENNQVDKADAFVACTGDDENNILAAVEAKELGAKLVLAVVSRPDYANVVRKLGIDYVVSPRTVMLQRIRGFLNASPVIMRSPLTNKPDIEVLEIEVRPNVPATQNTVVNLGLPPQCLIAGISQKNFVNVAGANSQMNAGDTAIVLAHTNYVEEILKRFM